MKFSHVYRKGLTVLGLAAMATMFSGQQADAATDSTQSMTVDVNVLPTCTVAVLANVNFGNWDPLTAVAFDSPTPGQVDVACGPGSNIEVRMGQGANADVGSTDAAPLRRMAGGVGEFVPYTLHEGAAGGPLLTNAVGGGITGVTAVNQLVFGQIPAGPFVLSPGAYTDTVTLNVDFN